MSYPGGKSGAGVYQTIINQIPPHRVYVEPFAGGAAILRLKKPAIASIAVDIDPAAVENLQRIAPPGCSVRQGDAISFLKGYPWAGDEFVYCDPPYLMETRSTRSRIYEYEFCTRDDHIHLLSILQSIPAAVMISGYPNALYGDVLLGKWRTIDFFSVTRGGKRARERLWMNYSDPLVLHDYRYLGRSFRERERIKRRQARWKRRLETMDRLERAALISAILDPGRAPSLRPLSPG